MPTIPTPVSGGADGPRPQTEEEQEIAAPFFPQQVEAAEPAVEPVPVDLEPEPLLEPEPTEAEPEEVLTGEAVVAEAEPAVTEDEPAVEATEDDQRQTALRRHAACGSDPRPGAHSNRGG